MPTELYKKVYNFLTNSPLNHITAVSVIYQVIEEEPWISKDESRTIVKNAINASINMYSQDISATNKLLKILAQFDDAFEGVCSLRDIGAVKMGEEKAYSLKEIETNFTELKSTLTKNIREGKSPLYSRLLKDLGNISISELSWKFPLGSKVISDDLEIIRKLPKNLYNDFMKPARRIIPSPFPSAVEQICEEFILNFVEDQTEKVLAEVAIDILNTLRDSWNNSAFDSEFMGTLNEGTYVTNVIVPAIRASLKNIPFRKSSFISTSERQSGASADRKGEGKLGRRSDMMFIIKFGDRIYELMYTECSRLICTERKKIDDKVNLWRETNGGMYWARKTRKPDKGEFGIIGLQVAGNMFHLNVLIRDAGNIRRYCRLQSAEICR